MYVAYLMYDEFHLHLKRTKKCKKLNN